MNLRPYTDTEWDKLPHVILTSETKWEPSDLDLDLTSDDQWFDSIDPDSCLIPNSRFDDFGNYLHRHVAHTSTIPSLEDAVDTCVLYHTNNHLHSFESASFHPYESSYDDDNLSYFDAVENENNLPRLSSFSYSIFNG